MENYKMKKLIVVLLMVNLALSPLFAESHVVDVYGGGDFTKIQAAIDAASDGDIILVNSDIHHLNSSVEGVITVNKELIIQGYGYDLPESGGTTIRSSGAIFNFIAAAEGSILRGFRLMGSGSPLVTVSANEIVIEDNLFMNGAGYNISLGGSISADTVRNNIFCPGENGNSGGGIYTTYTDGLVISNNLFAGLSGTPVYLYQANTNEKVMNNTFVSNTTHAITVSWHGSHHDYAYIAGNIFFNNSSGIQQNSTAPTITNNCFYNNTSDGTVGLEVISQNPNFVNYSTSDNYDEESYDTDGYDFHLSPGSPAVDEGPTLPEYRDLDGSLNDIGMYGWLLPIGTNGAPPHAAYQSYFCYPNRSGPR